MGRMGQLDCIDVPFSQGRRIYAGASAQVREFGDIALPLLDISLVLLEQAHDVGRFAKQVCELRIGSAQVFWKLVVRQLFNQSVIGF